MPSLDDLVERIDRDFDREHLASFWTLEPLLAAFVQHQHAAALVNRELQQLCRDPSYMGDWRPNQLMLHRGRGFALSIWWFERERRYLHTMPYLGYYVPLGRDPLRCTRYALPGAYDNAVFDPGLRIERIGRRNVQPLQILPLHGDRDVYDFHVDRPVPVLKLTTAAFHSLEWLFDRDTGYAVQANDSELSATQLRIAAYLLGQLGDAQSLGPLQGLLRHRHHAVRWAAIQGLGRLDADAARAALRQAVQDEHPHLRRAAQRTLDAAS